MWWWWCCCCFSAIRFLICIMNHSVSYRPIPPSPFDSIDDLWPTANNTKMPTCIHLRVADAHPFFMYINYQINAFYNKWTVFTHYKITYKFFKVLLALVFNSWHVVFVYLSHFQSGATAVDAATSISFRFYWFPVDRFCSFLLNLSQCSCFHTVQLIFFPLYIKMLITSHFDIFRVYLLSFFFSKCF